MQRNNETPSIGEVLDSLIDESTMDDLEFKFFLDALATKITRRQAIILRLMIMGITSQVEIAKMLGYSFVTISVDIKKLRMTIRKMLDQGEVTIPVRLTEVIEVKDDGTKGTESNSTPETNP